MLPAQSMQQVGTFSRSKWDEQQMLFRQTPDDADDDVGASGWNGEVSLSL